MRRKVVFDGEHTLEVAVPFDFDLYFLGWWYSKGARRATGTPAFYSFTAAGLLGGPHDLLSRSSYVYSMRIGVMVQPGGCAHRVPHSPGHQFHSVCALIFCPITR